MRYNIQPDHTVLPLFDYCCIIISANSGKLCLSSYGSFLFAYLSLNHITVCNTVYKTGPYTEGGGGAAAAVAPPQRKLNLQFLSYFKYIGQDKSCLIFKYIGAFSSFAPLAKKSCVRP